MTPDDLRRQLLAAGVLAPGESWTATPLHGGLNTRVFRLQAGTDPTGYIARVRDSASVASEAAALTDAAGCPGVPDVLYASDRILVHRYMEGAPRALATVDPSDLDRLMRALACLHQRTSPEYTPWPETQRVGGTLADLFRHRAATLRRYTIFAAAERGDLDPRLPELIDRLDSLAMPEASGWRESRFARLHGDLSIGNILWSADGVGLIDWEYSRVGDPAEDLAYLITEQAGDIGIADAVEAAYVAAGGDQRVWLRVPAYGFFTGIDSALWWADYAAREGPQPGAAREIAARVEAAGRWLAG